MSNSTGTAKAAETAAKTASEAVELDLAAQLAALKADIAALTERVGEKAASARGRLREGLGGEIDELRARLSDLADEMVRQGRGAVEAAEAEVNAQADRAREAVQRNPLTGLAVAVGLGFLLGFMARSSR